MQNIIQIDRLAKNLEDLKTMPIYNRSIKENVVAMTLMALALYPTDPDSCIEILDDLRGPRPLNVMDKQFLRDRFRCKPYIIRSYFEGATPANNYEAKEPYMLRMEESKNGFVEKDYIKIYVFSGGADSPRSVTLREHTGRHEWYLWEQALLADIRLPKEEDFWQ